MRYKEYHYRVNSIKKQLDNLRQINEEQYYIMYKQKNDLDSVTLQCANLRTQLMQVQYELTNLLGNYKKIIKDDRGE